MSTTEPTQADPLVWPPGWPRRARLEQMTPALMLQLGKIYNSLKDGMSSAGDWFELASVPQPAASAAQRAKDILRGGKGAKSEPTAEPELGGSNGDAA